MHIVICTGRITCTYFNKKLRGDKLKVDFLEDSTQLPTAVMTTVHGT